MIAASLFLNKLIQQIQDLTKQASVTISRWKKLS